MPSNYPAALDDLSNPSGSQRLSVGGGGHAALHVAVNDAVEAIQGALGTYPGVGAVLPFGAVGNGVADDRAALVLGDADARPMLLDAGKTYRVGSNLTLSGKIISGGGMLRPDAGVTITLAQAPDAGRYQIFDLSEGGTVTFAAGAVGDCVCAEWFGCVGDDGVTNNLTPMQAAITAAIAGGLPLEFGKGTFSLLTFNPTATLSPGQSLEIRGQGPQTVLKVADASMASDFRSVIIITTTGTGDVERVKISNLHIDGNRRNNVPATSTVWEHSALIRVGPTADAILKYLEIDSVTIHDPVADGVWFNTYYTDTVQISNYYCSERNGSRSDITFSGLPRVVNISNVSVFSIQSEPVTIPAAITHDFLIQMTNVECTGNLDILGEQQRLRCHFTNVFTNDLAITQATGYWKGGRVKYPSTKTQPRWNNMDRFVFEDVTFLHEATAAAVVYGIEIFHTTSYRTDVTARHCRFEIDTTLSAGVVTTSDNAVFIQPQATLDPERMVRFTGCWFDARFLRSVYNDRGGRVLLQDCDFGGTTGAFGIVNAASFESHMEVDGGRWDRVTGTFGTVLGGNSAGSYTVRNVAVTAARANYTTLGNLTGFTVRSDRLIWVTATPTGGAFVGDRAKLETPTAGAVCEWVATASHHTAATWKASKTLAA